MSMHMNRRRPVAAPPPPVETAAPGPVDWWLLFLFLGILCLGLMSLFSASAPLGLRKFNDAYYFFKRQLIFMSLGGVAIVTLFLMPRWLINRLHYWSIATAIILLIACLIINKVTKGSARWIDFGLIKLQPMEFTRIALVLYLSYFLGTKKDMVKEFARGLVPPLLATAIICGLLLAQPDYGGAAMMCMIVAGMCLAGGIKRQHLIIIFTLIVTAAAIYIREPYRWNRVMAFLDPFADKLGKGYQTVQSFYALGSGGIFGAGIGASVQKLGKTLPEAHNDYIMAVLGEETGFVGIAAVIVLFAVFLHRCYKVALGQKDLRDKLNAYGFTLVIAISFSLNMGVVLGVLPPKGVAMPFFSYGGSSLLSNMICVGFLLHYSRTARE